MRFGCSVADITPGRNLPLGGGLFGKSTRVADPLKATVFCLEDDGERVLLIGCDLIGFGNDLADGLRAEAARAAGIPREAVVLSATHTHNGPVTLDLRHWGRSDPAYLRVLRRKVVQTAREAVGRLAAARLTWSAAHCPAVGINRTSYGTAVDDALVTLRIEAAKGGRLLGLIVNHGCHPVTMHSTKVVSADFPGALRAEVGKSSRRDVPVLFLLGAAGDVNPREFVPDLSGRVTAELVRSRLALRDRVGTALACCALGGARRETGRGVAFRTARASLPLQPYPREDARLALRETAQREIRKFRNNPEKAWSLAEALVMRDWVKDAASRPCARSRDIELQVVRIGALRLLSLPVELFAAYGNQLRRESRGPLMVATMCNGYNSYVTTDPAIERRTYEAAGVPRLLGAQCYARGVGRRLVAAAARLLERT